MPAGIPPPQGPIPQYQQEQGQHFYMQQARLATGATMEQGYFPPPQQCHMQPTQPTTDANQSQYNYWHPQEPQPISVPPSASAANIIYRSTQHDYQMLQVQPTITATPRHTFVPNEDEEDAITVSLTRISVRYLNNNYYAL